MLILASFIYARISRSRQFERNALRYWPIQAASFESGCGGDIMEKHLSTSRCSVDADSPVEEEKAEHTFEIKTYNFLFSSKYTELL
jgi:hypothetical protein